MARTNCKSWRSTKRKTSLAWYCTELLNLELDGSSGYRVSQGISSSRCCTYLRVTQIGLRSLYQILCCLELHFGYSKCSKFKLSVEENACFSSFTGNYEKFSADYWWQKIRLSRKFSSGCLFLVALLANRLHKDRWNWGWRI